MPMKAHNGGFSLIEILVVIGAIGILVGIAIPVYNGYLERANIAEAQQVLKDIERAIIALAVDTGQWPNHHAIGKKNNVGANEIWDLNLAVAGLTQDDPGTPYPNWNGPYISEVPLDPWGEKYFYDSDYDVDGDASNDEVAIASFGPDRCCQNSYDENNVIIQLPCKIPDGPNKCE